MILNASTHGGPALNRPAWWGSALYAAAVTALVCYAAWPGFMSYDSLLAYEEGKYGIRTMLWPPLHAYMFTLSQRAGADAGGVLILQSLVLFWSAGLIVSSLVRDRLMTALLCVVFMASFAYVPSQLGSLIALWRDVPTASFALLALALWLQAARTRSRGFLLAAIGAAAIAVGLRYNAFTLLFALLCLMLWRPFLRPKSKWRDRAGAAIAMVFALSTAWASTQWRLPDLLRLPSPESFAGTQLFDVFGVSACTGRNYVPAAVSSGVALTPLQVRLAYDPTHLQRTLQPRPGFPRLLETGAGGLVSKTWVYLVAEEPRCYLAHRSLVFVEQLGMAVDAPFYPVHGGIDANGFGLTLASPERASWVQAYIGRNAASPVRRPYLLYLGALMAAGLLAWRRRDLALLAAAWLAGTLAYPAFLFIAAPAADARYIFPSNAAAALLMVVAAGLMLEHRPGETHRAPGAIA